MEFAGILKEFGGPTAVIVLVVVIFILLLREVKRDNLLTREALESHKKSLSAMLTENKAETEKQMALQSEELKKMGERIRQIERDYATIDYVQEVNSNWRTEIRKIDEKLDRVLMSGLGGNR